LQLFINNIIIKLLGTDWSWHRVKNKQCTICMLNFNTTYPIEWNQR